MDVIKPYGEPVFESMKGYEIVWEAGEKDIGPTQMRAMVMERNALQKAYVDHWNSSAVDGKAPVDGIIQAVAPWSTPRLGGTQPNLYVGYTGVWNYLGKFVLQQLPHALTCADFPSCTFPVTEADKSLDSPRDMKTFKQLNDVDGAIQADYDAEFYDGAPVSLQCVGRRLEEEKVLEMTEVIANALKQGKTSGLV
jgi:amidase